MKKSIGRKIKKIVLVTLLSTVVATFAVTAANAATTCLQRTTSKLAANASFTPVSYFSGYYEIKDSSHGPRAGTHYNTGSLAGAAYTKVSYISSSGSLVNMDRDGKKEGNGGWVESEWVEAPSNCKYIQQITFTGEKYNSSGVTTARDYVSVTKS